jgi:hypothetical protein
VPVPALPPLPPRSATEIVDGAVQLIRPQFGYFLRIAAIGAIPSLIQSVITLVVYPTQPADPTALIQQQLKLFPLTLLTYAFATVQSGAIISGALALLRGDALPPVWSAYSATFRRFPALLGANVLLLIALVVVLLPVLVVFAFASAAGGAALVQLGGSGTAGVIASVVAAVVLLAAVLFLAVSVFARSAVMTSLVVGETIGPMAALRRSHALSRGNYLLLAKTYALVMVIIVVVYGVMAGIASAFQDQSQVVAALLSVLIIPVTPIIGGVMLLTYADLRVRREGADLDAALDALPGAALPGA